MISFSLIFTILKKKNKKLTEIILLVCAKYRLRLNTLLWKNTPAFQNVQGWVKEVLQKWKERGGGGGSENSLFSYGKIFVTSERGRKKNSWEDYLNKHLLWFSFYICIWSNLENQINYYERLSLQHELWQKNIGQSKNCTNVFSCKLALPRHLVPISDYALLWDTYSKVSVRTVKVH